MKALVRLFLFLILLAPLQASAAEITPIRLGTGFFSFPQNMALLKDGRFATAWTDDRSGTVYLQYVDVDGVRALRQPGVAVSRADPQRSGAAVVAHAREGALVAVRHNLDGENTRIVVQWFDGKGRARWGAGALAAPVSGTEDQVDPYLVASPDGGAFVCFARQAWFQTERSAVYCQRFSPTGRRLWGFGGARATRARLLAQEPRALADADGGLFVFWCDFGPPEAVNDDSVAIHTRGQRLGADGGRRWGDDAKKISSIFMPEPTAFQLPGIELVADGAGGVIVAYGDQVGPPPEGVDDSNHTRVQRMSAEGEKLWGEGVSVLPTRPPHVMESLTPGPDGSVFVGLTVFPFGFEGGGFHEFFQRIAADGRVLWAKDGVPLLDPATTRDRDIEGPHFAAFDGEALRIVWEDEPVGDRTMVLLVTSLDPAGHATTQRVGTAHGFAGLWGAAFHPETGKILMVAGGFNLPLLGLLYTP